MKIKKVFSYEVEFNLNDNIANSDNVKVKNMTNVELNVFLDNMENNDGLMEKCNDGGMWKEENMAIDCDWTYQKA